jgi:hypothetical protein
VGRRGGPARQAGAAGGAGRPGLRAFIRGPDPRSPTAAPIHRPCSARAPPGPAPPKSEARPPLLSHGEPPRSKPAPPTIPADYPRNPEQLPRVLGRRRGWWVPPTTRGAGPRPEGQGRGDARLPRDRLAGASAKAPPSWARRPGLLFSRIVGDDESHLVASCAWPISPDVHERLTALPNSPPCRTRSPDMASKPHTTPVACGFESAASR